MEKGLGSGMMSDPWYQLVEVSINVVHSLLPMECQVLNYKHYT